MYLLNKLFLHFTLAVRLDGFKADGTKESEIMVGKEGILIAKNISRQTEIAVFNGNLSFTSNGTLFIPDKQSLNISQPKPSCAKGQTLRDFTYCCKFLVNKYNRL